MHILVIKTWFTNWVIILERHTGLSTEELKFSTRVLVVHVPIWREHEESIVTVLHNESYLRSTVHSLTAGDLCPIWHLKANGCSFLFFVFSQRGLTSLERNMNHICLFLQSGSETAQTNDVCCTCGKPPHSHITMKPRSYVSYVQHMLPWEGCWFKCTSPISC